MKIHKEGYGTIIVVLVFLLVVNLIVWYFTRNKTGLISVSLAVISLAFWGFIISFFRFPARTVTINENQILAPCDGKVVVVEEVQESEYFHAKCRQISIFMSPLNVHVNWYPINGLVKYYRYHPGKYLVAWHPKSSVLNERTTTVIQNAKGKEILVRQIAGYVARRVVCYAKEGTLIKQSDQLGFIKFGSRCDIFIPLDAKVKVNLEQKTEGSQTVIAEFE